MASQRSFDGRSITSAASPASAALIAVGAYAILVGAVFLLPFALSSYSIQNDVYMTNFFLSPLFFLFGAFCILIGLVAMRRSRTVRDAALQAGWHAALLAILGAVTITGATFLVGGQYESFGDTPIYWPPYLNISLLLFTLALGVIVGFIGALWRTRTMA
jgi:hypothetical protein